MNKEVFERLDKYIFSKDPMVKDDWYELINYFQQETKKLHNKIDKAINYIENHSRFEPPYYEMREFNNKANLNELYGILKDSDVDE